MGDRTRGSYRYLSWGEGGFLVLGLLGLERREEDNINPLVLKLYHRGRRIEISLILKLKKMSQPFVTHAWNDTGTTVV